MALRGLMVCVSLFAMTLLNIACSHANERSLEVPVFSERVGQEITIEIQGENRKNGVALVGPGVENLWLHPSEDVPDGYFDEGHIGAKVKVKGTLQEDHGLPVFHETGDELVPQGIPVPPGEDLEAASHRYLLENVIWEVVEE